MSIQTHLLKRNSTYYFRAKVPVDLRPFLGKREVKHSLKTKDPHEAKRLVRLASVRFDHKCHTLRARLRRPDPAEATVLDEAAIQSICEQWRYCALDGDERTRQEGLSAQEFAEQASARTQTQEALRQILARGQIDQIEPALQQFLYLLGVNICGDAEAWQRLRYRFLQTVAEAHNLQIRRDGGEVVWTPPAPAQVNVDPAPAGATRLQALLEDWERSEADRPRKTVDEVKRTVRDFQAVVGKKPAEAITRQDIMAFRDHLVQVACLRSKTIAKKITFLSALFNVAINNGRLTTNPASRIPLPKDDREPRQPYDLDDLKKILGSPLYTQGKRLGRHTGEASVWLPLLALYHGCREEELGQLLVDDVRTIDGIWCLLITDAKKNGKNPQPAKRLKNRASRRRLPLHPTLIEAGLLRYIKQIQSQGHARLFPALRPDRYGRLTSGFSKVYNKYTREVLGIDDPNKVFHSFRHTFRDACRDAGLDEELADALMGHSDGGKTGRKYGCSFSLTKLHEATCRIEYPGLEVPVLIPKDGE